MSQYVDTILNSMGDLLTVQAEPPVQANTADGTPMPAASLFDSQLYLFETVGMLISLEGMDVMKQTEYLKIVLGPLVEGIQKYMERGYNPDDELYLLQLHHYVMAIGSVAKGKVKKINLHIVVVRTDSYLDVNRFPKCSQRKRMHTTLGCSVQAGYRDHLECIASIQSIRTNS